jgi:hypothetical protein
MEKNERAIKDENSVWDDDDDKMKVTLLMVHACLSFLIAVDKVSPQ